jgi:hypothetical protein
VDAGTLTPGSRETLQRDLSRLKHVPGHDADSWDDLLQTAGLLHRSVIEGALEEVPWNQLNELAAGDSVLKIVELLRNRAYHLSDGTMRSAEGADISRRRQKEWIRVQNDIARRLGRAWERSNEGQLLLTPLEAAEAKQSLIVSLNRILQRM